jgi:NADPH-dependent F420 reductase
MTLAILGGTGKEGQGLALRWARAGREIVLGSRIASKGQEIADTLNEKLSATRVRGTSNREAAASADEIVVSTLPDTGHIEILTGLASELDGKILVVATIAWPPGPTSKPSAAEDAQEALGSAVRVVAAFQTVSAGTLRQTETEPEDVLICGDDADARETTRALVDATGLRGVIAGALRQARVAEAITGILLKINKQYGAKSTGIRITGIETS